MISLARSIFTLGAGHWMDPSSSLMEGARWYSDTSTFGFFGEELSFEGAALRFMASSAGTCRFAANVLAVLGRSSVECLSGLKPRVKANCKRYAPLPAAELRINPVRAPGSVVAG